MAAAEREDSILSYPRQREANVENEKEGTEPVRM